MKLDSILIGSPLEKGADNHILLGAAADLIKAIHGKDAKGVADALECAICECNSEPEESSDE